MNSINIIVDDREPDNALLIHLQAIPESCVVVKRLPIGDYQFSDKVIFERKTIKDFAKSIIDGRLFSQACRLLSSTMRGIFIIEGTAQDFATAGVSREAMQGALISISVILGIPVLRAQTPAESAQLMHYTVNQVNAATNQTISRHGYRPKGIRKLQLHILQGLPGIGPLRAKQLLEKFGSIVAVMNAGTTDLQKVEGIGEKAAARIAWVVKENITNDNISSETNFT